MRVRQHRDVMRRRILPTVPPLNQTVNIISFKAAAALKCPASGAVIPTVRNGFNKPQQYPVTPFIKSMQEGAWQWKKK
ncbi:hypothetical protein RP20_CCG027467 [Aedes albopictus]|nr:hypothetical protein RP20_CCG027467 [Aedes albopictus]